VGADRIVNAVAAFERLGGPCIVVDFGTATTFDVVTPKGEHARGVIVPRIVLAFGTARTFAVLPPKGDYAGGVIVPGISISAEALFEKAARLWRVEIRRPERVVGKTTAGSGHSA